MRKILFLLPALLIAACAPTTNPTGVNTPSSSPQAPAVPDSTPTTTVPVPADPVLTLTASHLLQLAQGRVAGGVSVQLTPNDPKNPPTIRIRYDDGTFSAPFGGIAGTLLTPAGFGLGPLRAGTVIEVLDGSTWVVVAKYR